jgi:transposase
MKQVTRKNNTLASRQVVSIGIDVHKRSWHVTAVSEGTVVSKASIPPRYEALTEFIKRFEGCEIAVAYEAGPFGFSLSDHLIMDEIFCIAVPPSLIPVESGNKVKTDKRDSLKLALLLEKNLLKKIFVLSREQRMNRDLLRTRKQLVEHRGDVMRQIKSKLLFHSIEIEGEGPREWSNRYLRNLLIHDFPKFLKGSFDALLKTYDDLSTTIRTLDKKIRDLSKRKEYKEDVSLLMTVPGIGRLTAMVILTELGDVSRFKNNEHLSSFLGLTPSEYSSGEHTRRGRITRCGNRWVRTCLIESSWTLIAHDPILREKYDRLKNRRGAKRAIVAIARSLAGRIRGLLLRREKYALCVG